MKCKAIIVDDEEKLRKVLKHKLGQYFPDIELVGEASNIHEAKALIEEFALDLVFLDIAMPGGSGFDLITSLEDFQFEIIFVTGFNEYALEALKLSAIDYLLKPVSSDDLQAAVNKALSKIEDKNKVQHYDVLKHNLFQSNKQDEQIAIPSSNAFDFVFVRDIIRLEGWQKYTKIFVQDRDHIVSSYSIGVFIDLLESYNFIQCHKSHIINKVHINSYKKEGSVVMSDGSEVPVSRRRKDDFLQELIGNFEK